MEKSSKSTQILWVVVPLLALTMILGACADPSTDAANLPPTTTEKPEAPNPDVNNYMPPLDNPSKSIRVEYLYDELLAQKHITAEVNIEQTGSLIVILGSNPSTGYSWQKAVISNSAMLPEYSHQYVEASLALPGASGKDAWTFKTNQTGTATITLNYCRSGEQPEWTVTLNITVK